MPLSNPNVAVSVEVSVAEVMRGIFEIEGLLSFEDEMVTFEYQATGLRMKRSGIQIFQLPLDAIQDVKVKGRAFWTRLVVHPKRLASIEDMPGQSRNRIVFRVKSGYRKRALALASQIHGSQSQKPVKGPDSIPFELPEIDLGLREVTGGVYFDGEFLVFEVQTGFAGGSDKDLQVIKVEPAALAAIRLEHGSFKDQLYIQPKKRDLLVAMPGKHREALMLKIPTRYRQAVEELVEAVTLQGLLGHDA